MRNMQRGGGAGVTILIIVIILIIAGVLFYSNRNDVDVTPDTEEEEAAEAMEDAQEAVDDAEEAVDEAVEAQADVDANVEGASTDAEGDAMAE